jgi:transcriptional regulator with XRE-family HTH domain
MISISEMQVAARTIRSRREALDLSRRQLAAESGVSEYAIKTWETRPDRDIKRPGATALPRILEAIGRRERAQSIARADNDGDSPMATGVAFRDPATNAVVAMLEVLPEAERARVIEQTLDLIYQVRRSLPGD